MRFLILFVLLAVSVGAKEVYAGQTKYYGPFLGTTGRSACESVSGLSGASGCGGFYLTDNTGGLQSRFQYPTGGALFAWSYAEQNWDPVKFPGMGTTMESSCYGSYYGTCTTHIFISAYYGNCPAGTVAGVDGLCEAQSKSPAGKDCEGVGDPLIPSLANSFQTEMDFETTSEPKLSFVRYYSSAFGFDSVISKMGPKWRHNHDITLIVDSNRVVFVDPLGARVEFLPNGSGWSPEVNFEYSLLKVVDGAEITWVVKDGSGREFLFSAEGQIKKSKDIAGYQLNYEFTAGLLSKVESIVGDTITFQYVNNRLDRVILNSDSVARFAYGSYSVLSNVYYSTTALPAETTKQYLYVGSNRYLLRGVIDESGVQYSYWAFDNLMRPTLSGRGSSPSNLKEKVTIEYVDDMLRNL